MTSGKGVGFGWFRIVLRGRLILPAHRLQRKNRVENLLYRYLGRLSRSGIITDMWTDLDAWVRVGERLARGSIDQNPGWFFTDGTMAHALTTGDHGGRHRAERVIECVRRGRIFRNLRVTAGGQTAAEWFNIAAFGPNTPGLWGNTPKGFLRGPGFWNVDFALTRNLGIGDGKHVEVRVETFNIFNHLNLGSPNTTFGSPNFGKITATSGGPRIMQFAAKFVF